MLIVHDKADGAAAHAEAQSDVLLQHPFGGHRSDSRHVSITEFGFVRWRENEPHTDCMLSVGGRTAPFEIGDYVVHLDPIDVVDLREVTGIRNERHCDQSVDEEPAYSAADAETNAEIFLPPLTAVHARPDYQVWPPHGSAILVDSDAINASHVPLVADFIKLAVDGDRNGPPRLLDLHFIPSAKVNSDFKSSVTKTQGV